MILNSDSWEAGPGPGPGQRSSTRTPKHLMEEAVKLCCSAVNVTVCLDTPRGMRRSDKADDKAALLYYLLRSPESVGLRRNVIALGEWAPPDRNVTRSPRHIRPRNRPGTDVEHFVPLDGVWQLQ